MKNQNVRRGGGAPIDQVGALHDLALKALIQQLRTEMDAGEVKAATVTAALKLCSDSGVTATQTQENEMAELTSMLDGLSLEPVTSYGTSSRFR